MRIYFIALALVLISCSGGRAKEAGPASPKVPAPGTMSIETSSLTLITYNDTNKSNHSQAVSFLKSIDILLGSDLVIPYFAIGLAYLKDGQLVNDNTWTWEIGGSVTFNDVKASISGTLKGTVNGSNVEWVFELTKTPKDSSGCCENFQWLTGSSSDSKGSWTVNDYESPTKLNEKMHIDWSYTYDTEKSLDLLLKNQENSSEIDINYTRDDDDISVLVNHYPSDDSKTEISWNRDTDVGKMTPENGSPICWDKNYTNETCE